jgi:hypothetical protein
MAAAPSRAWLAGLALAACLASPARAQDGAHKQEILLDELPEHSVDDAPFALAAKATSGLPVSLQIVAGPAVIDGKKVRLTGTPGLVVVRATQAGNDAWLPAKDVERAFTVRPRPSAPAIVSGPMGRDAEIGERVVLTADAAGEPAPTLQWRKNQMPISGATGHTLEIVAAALTDAASYDVVATNPTGQATSPPARINVTKRRQSILFQAGSTSVPAGQSIVVTASATSGLPVHFEVVSGIGSLSGNTLNSPGGSVVVQAEQPGDNTFEAAQPATQTYFFTSAVGSPHPP